MIAFKGYDGFMYSVGFLVAYLTVLLLVAEPLRNAGKYTMADLLAYRLKPRPVRAMASLSTLTVSTFYMIAQMVGAGGIIKRCSSACDFAPAVIGVGVLMLVYVVFGGMLATTWVQIIKAILLMGGAFALSCMVLKQFDFSLAHVLRRRRPPATYGGTKRAGEPARSRPGLRRDARRIRGAPLGLHLARASASCSAPPACRTSSSASTPCRMRRPRASAWSGRWRSSASSTS